MKLKTLTENAALGKQENTFTQRNTFHAPATVIKTNLTFRLFSMQLTSLQTEEYLTSLPYPY